MVVIVCNLCFIVFMLIVVVLVLFNTDCLHNFFIGCCLWLSICALIC